MSSEITTSPQADLALYSGKVDLVEVRRDKTKYPRVSETQFPVAVDKMQRLVFAAFLYRGQEASPTTMRFIADALVREINADIHFGLRHISWYEVGMVIRRAGLGGAREMYGVSVATLYAALVDYAKNEGHTASSDALRASFDKEDTRYFSDL